MSNPEDLDDFDRGDGFDGPDDFDPERITECEYWRCGDLFEAKSSNHRYCRKACRSRQKKWERAQERKRLRAEKAAARRAQR